MADYTSHYNLKKLGPGEHLSDDSYKYVSADRDLIDLILHLGAEAHQHTGAAGTADAPEAGPNVALITTSGTLPAGTRVYYRFTFVDVSGVESGASPEVWVDTPSQVASPAKPTGTYTETGGTLAPGNYYYVLSAYTGDPAFETPAANPEFIGVLASASTAAVTLALPALPSGASGFNVYRQAPNGPGYFFITSVDMGAATPPSDWTDTGVTAPNCDRTRPTVNTTRQTNSVTLTLPGATPTLAPGQSWRVYRTMTPGEWASSLLATVTDPFTTDTGAATAAGQPPVAGVTIGAPPKVQLTDSAETQGALPLARVSAFPQVVSFAMPGEVFPVEGDSVWVCEYPQATIVGVRAALGRGSAPAATDVVVDVNHGTGATPVMTSIFTALADQPAVPVGLQVGARAVPTAVTEMVEGDILTVDVDQAGGGATPTDRDLTVDVFLLVYGWTSDLSHVGA